MRKGPTILLIGILLLSTAILSVSAVRPMPVATIVIHEDLSATMKAQVFRIIHGPETMYFSNVLKAPILNWINYRGNVTINMTNAGPRGIYTLIAVPRPGDPTRRANFFPKAEAMGYFDNTTVHTMMSFFYGDRFLLLYGIRWNFVNVTYASTPHINYTGIVSVASVAAKSDKIKSLHMSFRTEEQMATHAMIVNYNLTVESLPLELRRSPSGYYYIDLTPLTAALPDDISANLWVNFTSLKISILGGNPAPKVVIWNDALWEFVPQLQENGKSLVVIVQKAEPYVPPQLILLAVVPPVIVGAYLFWRFKMEKSERRSSERKGTS